MRPAEPTNPSRAPRTPPRTHIPPNPYHDPSIKYAPARRPHDFMATQHTSRPRPIPNSLRLSLCLLPLEFPDWSLGIDDDLSRMHSAYDLNFLVFFLEAQSGFGCNCYAIHFTRSNNNTLFPPKSPSSTLVFPATILWFCVACRSHVPTAPDTIEMEWRESSLAFSVVVIFYNPLIIIFIDCDVCGWSGI